MMKVKMKGQTKAVANLKKARRDVVRLHTRRVKAAIQYSHESITKLTAVWSGRTIANWRWDVNTPSSDVKDYKYSGGGFRNGGPVTLGNEPQRKANQAIADASLRSLKVSRTEAFENYIISNPWWVAELMERGAAPNRARARTEKMVRITKASVLQYVKGIQ